MGVNKKQSHDFISIIKTKIAKDPITFLLNIAAELKAGNKTVKTAMYDNLSFKSDNKMTRHLFTDGQETRKMQESAQIPQESWHHC